MLRITHFLFLSLVLTASASPTNHPHWTSSKRQCGVSEPSEHLVNTHSYLLSAEPQDNPLWNSSLLRAHQFQASHLSTRQSPTPLYAIETYIHIVSDTASSSPLSPNYVTDTMIQNQFTYLQTAYAPAAIAFTLAGTTRTTNDAWATDADDVGMKTALRRGTYRTLNIYFQTELQASPNTPGIPAGSTLLGFCSLPTTGVTPNTPVSEYIVDGCNVLSGTMPGGTVYGYNLGGTAAHEVGHWNGLLHTFQDNTCSASDWGDYVADTPQEETSTSGCPIGKDTCPNSGVPANSYNSGTTDPYGPSGYSGVDPIHNFMDYSDDACYEAFTAGQGARMLNIWQIYREGL